MMAEKVYILLNFSYSSFKYVSEICWHFRELYYAISFIVFKNLVLKTIITLF